MDRTAALTRQQQEVCRPAGNGGLCRRCAPPAFHHGCACLTARFDLPHAWQSCSSVDAFRLATLAPSAEYRVTMDSGGQETAASRASHSVAGGPTGVSCMHTVRKLLPHLSVRCKLVPYAQAVLLDNLGESPEHRGTAHVVVTDGNSSHGPGRELAEGVVPGEQLLSLRPQGWLAVHRCLPRRYGRRQRRLALPPVRAS